MVFFKMRPIGFSTGALAYSDFQQGLAIIRAHNLKVVELSALRDNELRPLIDVIDELKLDNFDYVSFHVPSKFKVMGEEEIVELLKRVAKKNWPLIVHPDVIERFDRWSVFGELLSIENMDKRKPIGRTAGELSAIFEKLPDARLCFDLGHVRQVDPTMSVALEIIDRFGNRLHQLHVSEVNTNSQHDRLTFETTLAFQKISALIPESIPAILESRVPPERVDEEIANCREALITFAAA
jgi:hypothetical protein